MMPETLRVLALISMVGIGVLASNACRPPGKPQTREVPAESVTDFRALYSLNCAGCHGVDGKNGPGRILNDPLYLTFIPKAELKRVITYGRPGTAMPAWAKSQGGPMTDQQIDALVEGIESNWARPFNSRGSEVPAYSASLVGADITHGKRLFGRNCFMCHGPGAPIGSVTSASYLQLVSDQMLRTSIVVGRPDLGMPNYQHLNAGKALSNTDTTDLVAYMASLRPVEKPSVGEHVTETGTGQSGPTAKGNEGSGYGPGSPTGQRQEGTKPANTSQRGTIERPH